MSEEIAQRPPAPTYHLGHGGAEPRAALECLLDTLALGYQLGFRAHTVPAGTHGFIAMATTYEGFHTGRRRYLVACVTCESLVHEQTTGPIEHVERHMREKGRGE